VSKEEVSLYIHLPFCSKKCPYCHFYVIPNDAGHRDLLMQGLRLEWQQRIGLLANKEIVSIYFGGGTPALVGPESIAEILSWIPFTKAEVTLEGNPEEITLEQLEGFAAAGINRVSFGVQSLDDSLLKLLGRRHTADQAITAISLCKQAGIDNITIDLMYEIPTQTLEIWKSTLSQIEALPITHLSLYNLTFEPETLFFKKRKTLQPLVPPEQTALEMYRYAQEFLSSRGLAQYEISAFGKESLHNTGYWKGRPFIGLGPSAFSYWEGKRFRNVANLNRYCAHLRSEESPVDFSEELDATAKPKELLAVELRLLKGVDLRKHNTISKETKEVLNHLESLKLITKHGHLIALTQKGIPLYDSIAAELI
jgi:oxygen-independent coproporphyrinogen-3 oxidase